MEGKSRKVSNPRFPPSLRGFTDNSNVYWISGRGGRLTFDLYPPACLVEGVA